MVHVGNVLLEHAWICPSLLTVKKAAKETELPYFPVLSKKLSGGTTAALPWPWWMPCGWLRGVGAWRCAALQGGGSSHCQGGTKPACHLLFHLCFAAWPLAPPHNNKHARPDFQVLVLGKGPWQQEQPGKGWGLRKGRAFSPQAAELCCHHLAWGLD